jgi:Protein of unknown function (DUF3667)
MPKSIINSATSAVVAQATLPAQRTMATPAAPSPTCLNCDTAILQGQNFCPNCGQKSFTPRLTLHEIGEEFTHALIHVDRSALSLMGQLLVRPGVVAQEYVAGKRKRYFGPFGFLVVSVAFTSAVLAISGFQALTSDAPNIIVEFLQHHLNLMFFAAVPLIAAFARLIGFRDRYNYAEYLVLASYTGGMHILFYAVVVVPVWLIVRSNAALMFRLFFVLQVIGPAYFAYGMYQFLPGRRVSSVFKALLAAALSNIVIQNLVNAIAQAFV